MLFAKKWIIYTLISIFITLSVFATINFAMDPLWTFEHSHKYNQFQRARKERQQKSNSIYFRSTKYDTLLFGSSRITFMNQYKLDGKAFNYAVSDMQPREYNDYLNFAINEAQQPIKRVIIGLDFFGALGYEPLISKKSDTILHQIPEPFYRYKLLLSLDSLDYSVKNLQYYSQKKYNKYTYSNIKKSPPKDRYTQEQFKKNIAKDIRLYIRNRYSTQYDENYSAYLNKLKSSHPDIEFIIFTTPVTKEHFQAMLDQDLYDEYEMWIKESVEMFGEVNHFMYLNELTNNSYLNFRDSNHGYSATYECISNELIKKESKCPRINFIIDKNNLLDKLKELRELNLISN